MSPGASAGPGPGAASAHAPLRPGERRQAGADVPRSALAAGPRGGTVRAGKQSEAAWNPGPAARVPVRHIPASGAGRQGMGITGGDHIRRDAMRRSGRDGMRRTGGNSVARTSRNAPAWTSGNAPARTSGNSVARTGAGRGGVR
ncbi:hypothetical protein JCM9533A_64870 [Catenuloplanes niger JCM 9533]|uniref:Uncharacterized protein n=1 Tax=Catenuloplanes niger TaxID=587534 RepID=A0AAE4CY82_9ACTN|nr:hypothetical protein [Catenuloplanes niger]